MRGKWPDFYTIESMGNNGETIYSTDEMQYVGERIIPATAQSRKSKHVFYIDPDEKGWFEIFQYKYGRWMTDEEAIFGRKISKN